MQRRHLKAVRTFGYTLTLGDADSWAGLSIVLRARLEPRERAALAFAALAALDREDAIFTAEAALCTGAGQPIPPLLGFMDEAAFWADMAEPDELDAYALACVQAMAPSRRAAFLEYMKGRAA
ncbi:hypothetical protein SAMN05216257_105115 [Meinhardsimonia xiamenensis]|jgi:hypothetical protein|uniref:Uncharacterized protein n=2 Tax=Meinhardsimonia xiamenensis TaxID=990712 RepID=A0A1G9FBB6_9RHOB|nr:hypothetical protein LV81_00188 [Meinhardsimonia xiamenensis]SDK85620.1 hypothetical protein SAMN05216257_105115 [Meinhardsimonia xiamenensis]